MTARSAPGAGARVAATAVSVVRLCTIMLVVALPLVVNPFGPDAYAGAKVQVLYGLIVLILVGWAVAAAVRGAPPWHMTTPELAVWGFSLAVLASSIVSVNLRLTVFGAPGRYEGVLAVAAYIMLFFVGAQFFGTSSGVRRVVVAAGLGGAVVIAYGFAQMLFPPLFDGEATIRSWYGSTGLLRIFSTLGSPIVFGGYLVLIVPLALAAAVQQAPANRWWLVLGGAGSLATAATYTRAAWIALAAATGIFILLAGRALWERYRRALLIGSFLLVAVAAGVLVTADRAPVVERVTSALTLQTGSAAQRVYIWDQTLGLIRRRPVLGWGLETLREVFPYDRPSIERYFGPRPVIIDKAHNDLLQVAVSVGIPGAAAYLVLWILVIRGAYRVYRRSQGVSRVLAAGCLAALAGYLIQAQFSFSTIALAPLAWLLAGSVAGWEAEEQASTPASEQAERRYGQ